MPGIADTPLRFPPRTAAEAVALVLALFCVAAVPVLLVGAFVLLRAFLVAGFVFGLLPAWTVGWWPAW